MLRCRKLRVELEAADAIRPVMRGIDLEVRAGERVALMGPNGAGKSTLLRTCAGILEPERGSADVPGGCALLGQRPDDYLVRERVGEELPGRRASRRSRRSGSTSIPIPTPATSPAVSASDWRSRSRWRVAAPAGGRAGLICLDEPTRGLDRERKEDLAELDRRARGARGRRARRHPRRRVRRPVRRPGCCCSPAAG